MTDTGTDQSPKVEKQRELAPIHDFAGKLLQPELLPRLKNYVRWQRELRDSLAAGQTLDEVKILDDVPMSINLDLTTACNFACDHCVDMDILNTGIRYDHERLKDSMREMAAKGLKSVIVIGGGEPTVYPKFQEMMLFMKDLGLQLGLVTNGSYMDRVLEIADRLDAKDWVRLSLDSGSDEIFQAMHKPRKPITLDQICEGIPPIRDKNPDLVVGFSYIIVWNDCEANETEIHENIQEIEMAAERARKHRFSYISYKPFLTRAERNNAEIVDLATDEASKVDPIMAEIRRRIDIAKKLETPEFKVIESTNLRVFENGTYQNYTRQPKNCHMQWFRQVLSPLGIFNCPVYRHVPQAQIGNKHDYATLDAIKTSQRETAKLIQEFDASYECQHVTCLYNHVNWFIEDLIEHPEKLDDVKAGADRKDFFF